MTLRLDQLIEEALQLEQEDDYRELRTFINSIFGPKQCQACHATAIFYPAPTIAPVMCQALQCSECLTISTVLHENSCQGHCLYNY